MRLADELGLDDETERSDLFYALLLKDAGCSANSSRMAALFGTDDHAAKRTSKRVDWARPWPAFVWAARTAARGQAPRGQAAAAAGGARRGRGHALADAGALRARRADRAHARALRGAPRRRSTRSTSTGTARGHPDGLRGEQIPLGARIANLAQTLEIFWAAGGAARRLRARPTSAAARWFDPSLVAALDGLRRRLLGLARAPGSQPAPAAPTGRCPRTATRWTGSPTASPPSSTPSRRGPTGTRTARA